MLTYEDCVAFCAASKREIEAIAEHEHIPLMAAVEMASYLCQDAAGKRCIKRFILDDIVAARARGDHHHALVLTAVLKHFVATHPQATADRDGGSGG